MKAFLSAAWLVGAILWSLAKPIAPILAIAPAQAVANCDPNYTGTCVPKFSEVGDLDCKDIKAKNFKSVGSDPHRLDGDKDGIACEKKK